MAALNTPKAFDKALIPSSIREDIGPFADYVNATFDSLIRALSNQLTFTDNIQGNIQSVTAMGNVPLQIDTKGITPTGIFVLKSTVGIRSYSSVTLPTGFTQLLFRFDEVKPARTRSVDATDAPLCVYEVEALSSIAPGDTVQIKGFGNKPNNGTFSCIYRTENLITLYNPDAVTETKPQGFTGDRETSKTVSLFIF